MLSLSGGHRVWRERTIGIAICNFPEQLWNGVDSESEQWYEGEEEALYMGIEGLGEGESEGESAYL